MEYKESSIYNKKRNINSFQCEINFESFSGLSAQGAFVNCGSGDDEDDGGRLLRPISFNSSTITVMVKLPDGKSWQFKNNICAMSHVSLLNEPEVEQFELLHWKPKKFYYLCWKFIRTVVVVVNVRGLKRIRCTSHIKYGRCM